MTKPIISCLIENLVDNDDIYPCDMLKDFTTTLCPYEREDSEGNWYCECEWRPMNPHCNQYVEQILREKGVNIDVE